SSSSRAMANANSSCSVRSEKFFIARPSVPSLIRRKSGEVKAIQVHHLVPSSHEVAHKLLFRILTCIDLGEGSELGVRTEDEVDTGTGPFQLAGRAVADLEQIFGFRGR